MKKENPLRLWGLIWDAKIDQNRPQDESKFKIIFKSEKVALQEPLGAVLSRSWSILEAILGSKIALRYWNSQYFVKIHVFTLISFQDAFWTELGPTCSPKRPKMTPTWRPKTTQNRPKIVSKKWSKFRSLLRRQECAFGVGPAECAGLLGGF